MSETASTACFDAFLIPSLVSLPDLGASKIPPTAPAATPAATPTAAVLAFLIFSALIFSCLLACIFFDKLIKISPLKNYIIYNIYPFHWKVNKKYFTMGKLFPRKII